LYRRTTPAPRKSTHAINAWYGTISTIINPYATVANCRYNASMFPSIALSCGSFAYAAYGFGPSQAHAIDHPKYPAAATPSIA